MPMASAPARNQNGGESSVLVCPASRCPLPVWSRTFSSADALLEHARQTRIFHPICTTCLRVFKDTAALDQHIEAKHVVMCQPCNRKYKSQSALDQHWRASSAHPNCPVCDAGAPDTSALAMCQHIANAHPKVRCCGTLLDENDLDMHYFNSRNHPACDKCKIGFPTEQEYTEHNSELHAELQCRICSEQFPSIEALTAHTSDPTNHRRCEFCSAQFKDTSTLVEHYTETHLPIQESSDSTMDVSSMTHSPSPPMNQSYVHPIWGGAASAVVGAERITTHRPEPPSRASTSLSTSISDIVSDLCHSPPSTGTFTPSPPSLSASSLNTVHSQLPNNLPVQFPQSGHLSTQLPTNTTFPAYSFGVVGRPSVAAHAPPTVPMSPLISSHSSSPSPPLLVQKPPAGPATPVRRSAHPRSRFQSHLQAEPQPQSQPHASEQPPSSSRSKLSVAETPSGDLANFHLLNGSPLQSVADFDTPTPSPRTPSMPSVSPAGVPAFALASHGRDSLPLIADRRVLAPSSISPSVARAQRAITKSGAFHSPFYCRVCQMDPCREITATACGHLFCNACIVEEVRENARCPVCNAAVLLFALLKLDISS